MGIFSKKKKESELALIFDIGSSSVGGALIEMQKEGNPKIIKVFREPIIFEEKIEVDRFLYLTIKALEVVASRICMMGVKKPSKIFCVLSSPWYASQTRIIKFEKNTPFLFNSKLADDLIQKEIKFFEEEHLAKFGDTNDRARMIEFKNMKTMLNGYVTPMPFNKKAKKLEMTIFVSMSGEQILQKIENVIFRHFHSKDIKFSSFSLVSFVVARDMFALQEDFLLVDIAGEMTDISLIKKDILIDSISYPLGRNFIIRKVAENLNCTLGEAKSIFSVFKDGHMEKSILKKFEPFINKLKIEWLSGFQKSIISLSNDISVPSTIFITVDQDLADFFSEIIKTEQLNQYTLTESKFKIIFLDAKAFLGTVAFSDEVERDPFITIESIYINRLFC